MKYKNESVIYALDPKKTICAEQAFKMRVKKLKNGKKQFNLHYYTINPIEEIEQDDEQNLGSVIALLQRKRGHGAYAKAIEKYEESYQFKRNRGLKTINSKALKITGIFNENGTLINTDIALVQNFRVENITNESVTEYFYKRKLPSHLKNPMLLGMRDFVNALGRNVKNSSQLTQVIGDVMALVVGAIAVENQLPMLYREKTKRGVNRTTDPEDINPEQVEVRIDAPLRSFEKGFNFVQFYRFLTGGELLSTLVVERAMLGLEKIKDIAKKIKLYRRSIPKPIPPNRANHTFKKIGVNAFVVNQMDIFELIDVHAQAALSQKQLVQPFFDALEKKRHDQFLEKIKDQPTQFEGLFQRVAYLEKVKAVDHGFPQENYQKLFETQQEMMKTMREKKTSVNYFIDGIKDEKINSTALKGIMDKMDSKHMKISETVLLHTAIEENKKLFSNKLKKLEILNKFQDVLEVYKDQHLERLYPGLNA